jgi:hypothetical protein
MSNQLPQGRVQKRLLTFVVSVATIVGTLIALAQLQEFRDFSCNQVGLLCSKITLNNPGEMRFFGYSPSPNFSTLESMLQPADIPFNARIHTDYFEKQSSQRAFWELRLKSDSPPKRTFDFEVSVTIYSKSDGNPVEVHHEKGQWGANDPAAVAVGYLTSDSIALIGWPAGVYEVVLTITGKDINDTKVKRDFFIR